MTRPPDVEFAAFLTGVGRRTRRRAAIALAGGGLAAAALAILARGSGSSVLSLVLISLAAAIVVAAVAWFVAGSSRARLAAGVERGEPLCRNLVITAAELLDRPDIVPAYVRSRVLVDAATFTRQLPIARLVPVRRAWLVFVIGGIAWSAALAWATVRVPSRPAAAPSSASAASIGTITIEIRPPDYAQLSPRSTTDPPRVEALSGSRLRVLVTADAGTVELETIAGRQTFDATGARAFAATMVAEADGFLAITPTAADGTAGTRRVIGLSVTPDELPRVRITAPGKDLLLASGGQTVALEIDAQDDLGLAAASLTYTRVAGSGESFTFTEGDVPVELAKATDRHWTGRARWRLNELGLQPGDMLIYRATATDRRPGAPAAESDTFIIEIAAPGALASEGFAVDDRPEKYAISQQMVIVKTERLLARRGSMPAAEFRDAAQDLAAEQRQVRAEFVFMMGGELADAGLDLSTLNEEAEAAGEDDLAAGRLANQGRMDLMRAIRSMSRAAARLAEPDVPAALPIEKEALAYLQRAFSRSRYILRTLGERERLDLSRRLTGTLAALSRPRRPAAESAPEPRLVALRRLLAETAALSGAVRDAAGSVTDRAAAIAQRLLQVDPGSDVLAGIAATLTGPPALTPAALDRATSALASVVRAELAAAPARTADPELAALDGALADERRRRGGGR